MGSARSDSTASVFPRKFLTLFLETEEHRLTPNNKPRNRIQYDNDLPILISHEKLPDRECNSIRKNLVCVPC